VLGLGANIADILGAVDQIESIISPPPELCVAGSNTILGEGIQMAVDWKSEFEASQRARVAIKGVGSVRGVEMAAAGECVHVLAMSEPITPNQLSTLNAAGVSIDCAAEIGFDVIAFVTNFDNPVPTINIRDLDNILIGQVRYWSELSSRAPSGQPIYILARPGSGTTDFVLTNIAEYTDPIIGDDQYFPPNTNYIPCSSNDACLDLTLSTNGSLYWVSTAWMETQPEQYIRVIPILQGDERPINPLIEKVNLDEYPVKLIRPLYLYVLAGERVSAESNDLARQFLSYVRSVRGQQIVERHGFYNHFNKPRDIRIPLPPGFSIPESGPRTICR
jgi:phosphate transport system substrate-binding protein